MANAKRRYLPDFQVVHVPGPLKTTQRVWERSPRLDVDGVQMRSEDGHKLWNPGTFRDETITIAEAWDVYFPRGHSIRIITKAELVRGGFDKEPAVTDHVLGIKLEGSEEAIELADLARARSRLRQF